MEKIPALLILSYMPRLNQRIMFEEQQPLLLEGQVQDPSFRLQCLDREQIVTHDVGERQMRNRRDQIAEEEGSLPFRLNLDTSMTARVAGSDHGSDAGEYFRIAVQEFPLIYV